jgi:hypothetical protein
MRASIASDFGTSWVAAMKRWALAILMCASFQVSASANIFQESYKPPMRSAPRPAARPENPKPANTPPREASAPKPPLAPKPSPQPTASSEPKSQKPPTASPVHREDPAPEHARAMAGPTAQAGGQSNPRSAANAESKRALKRDLPGELEVSRSRELLAAVYAEQMRDESIGARRRLARELLEEAIKCPDHSADQYVLLSGAVRACRDARHLRRVYEVIDVMARYYDIDELAAKLQLAREMPLLADVNVNTVDNVRAGLELVDQLVAAGDLAGALKLCEVLATPASVDAAVAQMVQTRSSEVEALRKAHDNAAAS